MIKKLNHIAIAVPDLALAASQYKNKLGAVVSEPSEQPEHGVSVVFVELENAKIELLEPLGENSPIAKFLARNPEGGIHHICLEVDDIDNASKKLRDEGVRILGSTDSKIGAHGKPVLFIHPKDFFSTLIELEEA